MAAWLICRLDRTHDRSTFQCGHEQLDNWLRHQAGQFDRRDISRTFAAVRPNESKVLGYYALSTHRVLLEHLPATAEKGLPKLDVLVVLIGRLAVDHSVQGQGLGANLLVDALRRSLRVSEEIGVRAVEVDAIDEVARSFYLSFGFRALLDDPRHLFLPMHEIRKLGLEPRH